MNTEDPNKLQSDIATVLSANPYPEYSETPMDIDVDTNTFHKKRTHGAKKFNQKKKRRKEAKKNRRINR